MVVRTFVSSPIARLSHFTASPASRRLHVHRHGQSRNAIAEPEVEQADWAVATTRPVARMTAPRSVIKRREHERWA
jgi:hypothetical protein